MTFRLIPLAYEPFAPFFAMDEATLRTHLAERHVAVGGEPCRVTLAEAEPGETLLLVNHLHQPAATPFRASHAIYVRRDAAAARPAAGELPPALRSRLLSLRGFDAAGQMVAGEVVAGSDADALLGTMADDPGVAEVHIHFARRGCYAARAVRA